VSTLLSNILILIHFCRVPLDIVNAFQSYGAYIAGTITEEERQTIVRHACPGQGACGGMYTANTMAVAAEALGMSLPYSSSYPANSPEKLAECYSAVIINLANPFQPMIKDAKR
jgi:dihydroxy-acid dehydratase